MTTDTGFSDAVTEDLLPRYSTTNPIGRARRRSGRHHRTKSEWKPSKGTAEDILPSRLEKRIYALAETSGNMKRMSVELDTHQKCVTNLAATVVRQNNQIRELKRHIKELVALLETTQKLPPSCVESMTDLSDSLCSTSTPGSQVSSPSEFSKENDDRDTVLDPVEEKPELLQETLKEAAAAMMAMKEVNSDNSSHTRLHPLSTTRHMHATSHVGTGLASSF